MQPQGQLRRVKSMLSMDEMDGLAHVVGASTSLRIESKVHVCGDHGLTAKHKSRDYSGSSIMRDASGRSDWLPIVVDHLHTLDLGYLYYSLTTYISRPVPTQLDESE